MRRAIDSPGATSSVALDSFRRQLERPGEHECDRKPEEHDRDKHLHHPRRRLKGREQNRRRLNEQPRHHRVGDRDLVNIAPLQLGEEILHDDLLIDGLRLRPFDDRLETRMLA